MTFPIVPMPRKGAWMLSSDGASTNFAKRLGRLQAIPIGIVAVAHLVYHLVGGINPRWYDSYATRKALIWALIIPMGLDTPMPQAKGEMQNFKTPKQFRFNEPTEPIIPGRQVPRPPHVSPESLDFIA
ncbi:hypothetical protein N7527_000964 [Penicillium freii]|nr:hypothetical protein N7527_000964 [Penicillium freii]